MSNLVGMSVRTLGRMGMLAVAVGALLAAGGCRMASVAPLVPPRGFLYAHFRAPLILPDADAELDGLDPERPSDLIYVRLPVPYVKTDITMGRVDLDQALKRAGIETLIFADYEYLSYFGLYQTVIIHAHGRGREP